MPFGQYKLNNKYRTDSKLNTVNAVQTVTLYRRYKLVTVQTEQANHRTYSKSQLPYRQHKPITMQPVQAKYSIDSTSYTLCKYTADITN